METPLAMPKQAHSQTPSMTGIGLWQQEALYRSLFPKGNLTLKMLQNIGRQRSRQLLKAQASPITENPRAGSGRSFPISNG